jgi:hypothetical protein
MLALAALISVTIAFPTMSHGRLISVLGVWAALPPVCRQGHFPEPAADILLLLRRPFRVGDEITTGEFTGKVEAIKTRATKVERDWRVWFSFWGLAIADPEFAAEQRERMREFVGQITAILAEDPGCVHLTAEQHPAIASALLAVLFGIVTQAIFDPEAWPAARQAEAVDEALTRIAGLVFDHREG